MRSLWLLSLSAGLYAFTLIMPHWCAEFGFIWPILFFYTVKQYNFSWLQGIVWGMVFYTLSLSALAILLWNHAHGAWRLLWYGVLVIYGVICSQLFFVCARWLAHIMMPMAAWFIGLYGLLIYQKYYFQLIIGTLEGYPFLNPLLPLAVRPQWLLLVRYCGMNVSIALLLLTACLFVELITSRYFTKRKVSWTCLCLALWVGGWFVNNNPDLQVSDLAATCGMPQCLPGQDQWQKLIMLAEQGAALAKKSPYLKFLIMPESSLDCLLHEQKQLLACWRDLLPQSATLLVGAQREEGHSRYNTVFSVRYGRIISTYDKINLMPITESSPTFFLLTKLDFFKGLFTKNKLSHGQFPRTMLSGTPFLPYLCSEFFFAKELDGKRHQPILCLAHDGWFSGTYLPYLMYLQAKMQAIIHKRTIVYCAYQHKGIFDQNGNEYALCSS